MANSSRQSNRPPVCFRSGFFLREYGVVRYRKVDLSRFPDIASLYLPITAPPSAFPGD
jgi:hypothetical protein